MAPKACTSMPGPYCELFLEKLYFLLILLTWKVKSEELDIKKTPHTQTKNSSHLEGHGQWANPTLWMCFALCPLPWSF